MPTAACGCQPFGERTQAIAEHVTATEALRL